MIEAKNSELKNKIKKNFKFYLLILVLCSIAWFGVKMIVYKPSATTATASPKKSNSLLPTGGPGVGAPPAEGYIPYSGTSPNGGAAAR